MFTNKSIRRVSLRGALMASAVSALTLAAGAAQALEWESNGVKVKFDTTASIGATFKASDINTRMLSEANGGPRDSRTSLVSPLIAPTLRALNARSRDGRQSAATGMTYGIYYDFTPNDPTWNGVNPVAGTGLPAQAFVGNYGYAGSINNDDGALNYDKGDLVAATAKATHELEVAWDNLSFFARASYFYDAAQDQAGAGKRTGFDSNVRARVGRGFQLLDAYGTGKFDVGDQRLTVKVGQQVVNWGESTFIQNGNNVVNTFDLTALRKPGSELKEALLPTPMLFASLSLPADLSVEGWYQFKFDHVKLDAQGTFFNTSDTVTPSNSSIGGNVNNVGFLGGGFTAGTHLRNCRANQAIGQSAANAAISNAACTNDPAADYRGLRNSEADRLRLGDINYLPRYNDTLAKDSGQYGLALRWFAEDLNQTEFGFYFANYHSRLPIVSYRTDPAQSRVTNRSVFITDKASLGTRGAFLQGCQPFINAMLTTPGASAVLNPGNTGVLNTSNDPLSAATRRAVVAGTMDFLGTLPGLGKFRGLSGQRTNDSQYNVTGFGANATIADVIALRCAGVNNAAAVVPTGIPGAVGGFAGTPAGTGLILPDGAETWGVGGTTQFFLEYPENIKMFGMSFNTTVGTWGVQGDFSFKQDQPLQIDTLELLTGAIEQRCGWQAIFGAAGTAVGATANPYMRNNYTCDATRPAVPGIVSGYVRRDVFQGQIGTTATFQPSVSWVRAIGSDQVVLVTEVAVTHVNNLPDTGTLLMAPPNAQGTPHPLGGLLGLDPQVSGFPTATSGGYVILAAADYTNAFGSPVTLTPSIAFSHDVFGITPLPLGNFIKNRKTAAFTLGGSYLNQWRGSLSYVNSWGGGVQNKGQDRDFVGMTLSYAF